ncbi:YgiT-type zinc finger protein [Vibrio parahaemolyticus]|nr:YgiT-type zinc finger protein [Vibrio parahaemolyticus]ELC0707653.1 YgiT-type zinc finger protein [Vibrio parahaemolyticus]
MKITDFFPEQGQVQRLYCDECQGHLDLVFTDFHELVTGVNIEIKGLPMLHCDSCDKSFFPDDSRFSLVYLHEQAFKKSNNSVTVIRNKTNQDFGFGVVPFIYDSDDYKYIPGLKRPWNDGFLTPVFFSKDVLLKYDSSPTYRLSFASTTYGEILSGDDFSIPFGINKNGKVIMWLGDIARLPDAEQYYLRSENIESDHSIGSEFYDGQIECIFTDPSKEDTLFKSRSVFLEACFNKFGRKIAHLDSEVFDLSVSFNTPVVDTEKERRHVADTLNKIYLESFDNKALGDVIVELGGDPQNLGSIKRLQKMIELSCSDVDIFALMSPFYILYDLRVVYSHIGSKESEQKKLDSVIERLELDANSGLMEIYPSLVEKLGESYERLTELFK